MVSIHTPMEQLFKLPFLIGHLIKHQKQDGVSLLKFLQDHYAPDHNDADLPEDQQLPFKKLNFHGTGYAIVTRIFQANLLPLLPAGKKVMIYNAFTPQLHSASIFHPPRV